MQRKRKIFLTALLLFVHALLLFHEVTVNHVLCYKPDGSVELEMAMFDFQCLCKNALCREEDHHDQSSPPLTQTLRKVPNTCYDQPFNGNWLERTVNHQTEENQLLKLYNIYIEETNHYADQAFGCFFEFLPLRKFLNGIPPQQYRFVLLC